MKVLHQALSVGLGLTLAIGLAACGGGKNQTKTSDKAPSTSPASASASATPSESNNAREKKDAATKPTFEPATVRVAYMPNIGSAGSIFTAIEKGYFKEVGLTVETKEFQGGPAEIAALSSGNIDIAQIGHGAHALCIEGQAVIFQNDQTNSLADEVVGNRSKGVQKPEDLKGKKIAVASGTSSEIILHQVLAKAGLSLSDVEIVEMTNEGMTTAMLGGSIDACAAWSPNTVTLKNGLKDNYVCLGGNADFADKATFPGSFITTNQFAKEHKDLLVRFAAAINKAHEDRSNDTEAVARLLSAKVDVPEDVMLGSVGEGDWKTITQIAGDTDKLKKVYETQQQVFIDAQRIKEKVPVEKYVLFDIMAEAFKLYQTVY